MRTLADLQRTFAGFLLSSPGADPDPALCNAVRESSVPSEKRLAIYKNNVYVRLVEALEDSYPAVRRLTGATFFRFAAMEYIRKNPPHSPTLLGYGENFPCFLDGFEPAASVPYLADVARLEQLYLESYHAAEALPLPKQAVAELLQEAAPAEAVRAHLRLHPSARLMVSASPVSHIWEINRQSAPIDRKRQIPGGEEYLLIVRPRATVEVRRISRGAHAALAALERRAPVTEAMAAGSEADPGIDIVTHLLSLADGATFCSWEITT